MTTQKWFAIAILLLLGSGLSASAAYADQRGYGLKKLADQRAPGHESFRNMTPGQRQQAKEQFRAATPEQRQQWRNENPEQARQLREDANNRFQERWQRADGNGNGRITRQDAARHMPGVARHFDEIDTNHDGVVTQDEVRAFQQRRAQDRMNQNAAGRDPRN
jgi:Ca2+-binding EF-hand superfamily protein